MDIEIVKWRDAYNLGIEEIDTQHRLTIELINTLYNTIRQEKSDTDIEEILIKMREYADQHFRDEERLLEENNFPDIEQHKEQHLLYNDKLEALTSREDCAITDTYSFLRQWWTEHIMNEDKEYGAFFAQQKNTD